MPCKVGTCGGKMEIIYYYYYLLLDSLTEIKSCAGLSCQINSQSLVLMIN